MHLTGYKVVYGKDKFYSCIVLNGKYCLEYEIDKETEAPSFVHWGRNIVLPLFLFDTLNNAISFYSQVAGSTSILECKYIKYDIKIPKFVAKKTSEGWIEYFWGSEIFKKSETEMLALLCYAMEVPKGTVLSESIIPIKKIL